MLQGLPLRRAILDELQAHKAETPEASLVREEDLARKLKADRDRLEAHFTFLERAGYVSSLHVPGPGGVRMRFLTITADGERYLKNPENFETPKGLESPFKVIEKEHEKVVGTFAELRQVIASTEWVLDEEKPELLNKLHELQQSLEGDKIDTARVSILKLYFEQHKWLSRHVSAIIKKHMGF